MDRLQHAAEADGVSFGLELVEEEVPVGGGSLPGFGIKSCALAIQGEKSADDLSVRLRGAPVSILSRIRDQKIMLDLRAVSEEEEEDLLRGVLAALH